MALITFLSDFGTKDFYTAAVKAKLLSLKPDLQIIDISHEVDKFNLLHAAFMLKSMIKQFPEGSIHLVSVKSELSPTEPVVIVKCKGQYIIGTDNGLLGLAFKNSEEEKWFVKGAADAFPAMNLMAEVTVKVAEGTKIDSFAEKTDTIKSYMLPQVRANKEMMQGQVIHVDDFGNLITNLEKQEFDLLSEKGNFIIKVGRNKLNKVNVNYAETTEGELFAIFNSMGLLEIGIYEGRAAALLGMEYGSNVMIEFL